MKFRKKTLDLKWEIEGIALLPEAEIPYVNTIVYPKFVVRGGLGLSMAVKPSPDPRTNFEIRDGLTPFIL